MSQARLDSMARLRRPTAVIGWLAGLYMLATVPLTAINFDENWRHPLEGLTIWMVLWLVLAAPLSAVAAVLAARMERAATGVRHRMRAAWVGVSLGVFLAAHWAVHLLWSPAYLFWGLTSSYNRDDHFAGAVFGMLAWAFFAGGIAMARTTARKLRARSWEGETGDEGPRRFPRVPTPILGALAYAMATFPGAALAGVIAVEERSPWVAIIAWSCPGLLLGGLGALWGAWAYEGLPHSREVTRFWPRFAELFGAAWIGHWLPVWLIAVAPVYGSSRHEEQLVASLLVAFVVVGATAAWSYGRAARRLATA